MRRRGDTHEPVEDYLDTNRPAHEKSRRGECLATSTATATETPSSSSTNIRSTAMSNDTQHTRPAGIPPRFTPVYDSDGSIFYWVADYHDDGALSAEAVKPTTGDTTTRYNVNLNLEEGTASEARQAVLGVIQWWMHQECHLEGVEASK